MSKCNATLASIAAPPRGVQGPNYPRHHWQVAVPHPHLPRARRSATEGSRMGCDGVWGKGCSCDTRVTHSKLQKEAATGLQTWCPTLARSAILPPPPKILPAAFFVCGINFVGITGKIGNMVTGNNFWGINSIELPESLAGSEAM